MKKIIITLITIIVLFICYGFFINPKEFKINEYTIYTDKISDAFDGFKIVHFSDTLLGSSWTITELEKLTDKINEVNADIIIFSGDLIYKEYKISSEEKEKIKGLLKNMNCNLYKYAVIGDNDQEQLKAYKEIMSEADFEILDNESTYLFYKDINPIELKGITNTSALSTPNETEEGITPNYHIVISHYPDNFDSLQNENVDLYLAGHSLGGQIRVPFWEGIIIKRDGANTYSDSYYKINNTDIYVSNGLGTEKYPFRTFNTPSINVYRINKNRNN